MKNFKMLSKCPGADVRLAVGSVTLELLGRDGHYHCIDGMLEKVTQEECGIMMTGLNTEQTGLKRSTQ